MINHHSERYVLVKAFRGAGLGDALRAVILALLYAERNGRQVVVDWSDGTFGAEGDEVFCKLFRLKEPHCRSRLIHFHDNCSVIPPVWIGKLSSSMRSLWLEQGITGWDREFARKMFSFDQSLDHQDSVCVMWDFDNLSSYKCSEIQKIVSKYLVLSDDVMQKCQDFVSNRFSETMLGIHIRAANEPKAASRFSSKYIIQKTVEQLLNTNEYKGIFLSTDHFPTQEWFLRVFPGSVVRDKPFPEDGAPLHLSQFGQERLDQSQDALIDMALLSSCQAIVHPGCSSFSLCATYLSSLPSDSLISLSSKKPFIQRLAGKLPFNFTGKY